MKTLIIVFTYKYPFAPPTEQFLHVELPYLKKENVDIEIVPYASVIDFSQKYSTETNVNVMKRNKIIDLLLGFKGVFSKEYWKERKIIKNLSSIEKGFAKENVLKVWVQAKMFFLRMKNMFKLERLKKYDKVILYSYWFNSMAISIELFKEYLSRKNICCKSVSRAHGQGDLYIGEGIVNYRPFSGVLKKIDKIFSISDDGTNFLKNQGFENVCTQRLGVSRKEDSNDIIDSDCKKIVSCSVINDNKRVVEIAKVIASINSTKINWIHFGGGPNQQSVQDWCEKNMPENVEWKINGWTDNDEVIEYYLTKKPDVFINLSIVEGIPVSIMEAMSCRVCCVATDVGATREIVKDGINGKLIDKDFSTQKAKESVEEVIFSENLREFRNNAYKTWKDEYDSEKNFIEFSQKMINI